MTTETKKRGRGRPRSAPATLIIRWPNFRCVFANPVAQVYSCIALEDKAKGSKKATTLALDLGQCFVILIRNTEFGPEEVIHAKGITRDAAIAIANNLYLTTDDEERFPLLAPPNDTTLYRNRLFEVRFSQPTNWAKPFVVVDMRTGHILLSASGRPRVFPNLFAAIEVADQEERKLLP